MNTKYKIMEEIENLTEEERSELSSWLQRKVMNDLDNGVHLAIKRMERMI